MVSGEQHRQRILDTTLPTLHSAGDHARQRGAVPESWRVKALAAVQVDQDARRAGREARRGAAGLCGPHLDEVGDVRDPLPWRRCATERQGVAGPLACKKVQRYGERAETVWV